MERLAKAGHAMSQYCYACAWNNGEMGSQSHAKSLEWMRKAADQGHEGACAGMGDAYHLGQGVAVSYKEAVHWYARAPHHAVALDGLGHLTRDGHGTPMNSLLAIDFFRQSAEQGYPPGCLDYAVSLYERGNVKESLEWFEKGARAEEYLDGYHLAIARCQYYTAQSIAELRKDDLDRKLEGVDPFPSCSFGHVGLSRMDTTRQSPFATVSKGSPCPSVVIVARTNRRSGAPSARVLGIATGTVRRKGGSAVTRSCARDCPY
jgi:hypothetical protein